MNTIKMFRYILLSISFIFAFVSNIIADDSSWNYDLNKAKQSYLEGNLGEAIIHVENALSKMPNDGKYTEEKSKAKKNLVSLYLRHVKNTLWEGEYEKALGLSNKVINLTDDDKVLQEAFSDKGMAYSFLKRFNESNEFFSKAINLSPASAELYIGRASLYIQMACSDWKKACSLNKEQCNEYKQAISNNICE